MSQPNDFEVVNWGAMQDTATIMVVDDSQVIKNQVRDILKGLTLKILEAGDGEEALLIFQKNPQIRMVLCDINMPKLDGLGFLAKLAAKTGKPPVPVIMLTTENQLEKVMIGKKHGASAWLLKPPQPQDVLRLVQKFTAPPPKKAG